MGGRNAIFKTTEICHMARGCCSRKERKPVLQVHLSTRGASRKIKDCPRSHSNITKIFPVGHDFLRNSSMRIVIIRGNVTHKKSNSHKDVAFSSFLGKDREDPF